MAIKMRPPDGADVRALGIAGRTYTPSKDGSWKIDEADADEARRLGWTDADANVTASGVDDAPAPSPEA